MLRLRIPMNDLERASAFSRVVHLASQRSVHEAFQWLHLQEPRIMDWQAELVEIAAPPFHERDRAAWLCERFRDLGLENVEIDASGNALGYLRRRCRSGRSVPAALRPHRYDLPAGPTIRAERESHRLKAPGACDNGAGLAGLLAIAAVLKAVRDKGLPLPLHRGVLFAGNVGEEGEGDLRGIRYLYEQSAWRKRIAANIVLDGAGHEVAVTEALGSRRFLVTISAPGGHSWTDAGNAEPNRPDECGHRAGWRRSRLSDSPRTTWNVGTIEGGTSVNAIPENASARFDFRSTDPEQLVRLEVELHRAVEDVVLAANREAAKSEARGAARATKPRPAPHGPL